MIESGSPASSGRKAIRSKADTDGDGLPDGWESRFGFNPLDNGTRALTAARRTS